MWSRYVAYGRAMAVVPSLTVWILTYRRVRSSGLSEPTAPVRRRLSSAFRVYASRIPGHYRCSVLTRFGRQTNCGCGSSELQDSALPDRLRIGEAVHLFGGRDTDGLLEQFGLARRRRSAFASLSGGERQRLVSRPGIAESAAAGHPRRTYTGTRPGRASQCVVRGRSTATDGTTVLLVTHELDEAEALCDRVIAMRAGRILDAGTPEDLIDRHGRWATIRFTLPLGRRGDISLEALGVAKGVRTVDTVGERVTIHGDRTAIAWVGAALTGSGWVPPDRWGHAPSLRTHCSACWSRRRSTITLGPLRPLRKAT